MTELNRVRVAFSGFPGGPGVATYYFLDTATAVASLSTYYGQLISFFPPNVSIQVENQGDKIEDTTGVITGAWGADPVPAMSGIGTGKYSAQVGALARWKTNTILDGHRLRGRTFLVPITAEYYTTGGVLDPGAKSGILGPGQTLVVDQSTSFVVWHRPYAGRAAVGKLKAKPAHLGGHGLVTVADVAPTLCTLNSRRPA
jgi:hypothetical protein